MKKYTLYILNLFLFLNLCGCQSESTKDQKLTLSQLNEKFNENNVKVNEIDTVSVEVVFDENNEYSVLYDGIKDCFYLSEKNNDGTIYEYKDSNFELISGKENEAIIEELEKFATKYFVTSNDIFRYCRWKYIKTVNSVKADDDLNDNNAIENNNSDNNFGESLDDIREEDGYSNDTSDYTYNEEMVWQYCMDRWDYYDALNGGYSGDLYTENVFRDAGNRFGISAYEAEMIWQKVDRAKLGVSY